MAIFIEGPDLAGKTTLARRLAKELGREYIKETVYGASVFDVYGKHLRMGDEVVVDRSYFSEIIYPLTQKNRRCGLEFEEIWNLALYTMRMGGAHLILCPHDGVLSIRYGMRGDGRRPLTQILRVAEIYRRIERPWWVPTEAVVSLHGTITENMIQTAVQHALHYEETRFCYDRTIGHGWGSMQTNKILIVGDRFNPRGKSPGLKLPLCTRRRQSTAGYLYTMLRAGMIPPRDVHIINAYEQDGTPHDGSVFSRLRPRAIVALGNNALDWCIEHSPLPLVRADAKIKNPGAIPIHHIEHPAYLRRFWNHFAEDFGYALGKDLGNFNEGTNH